MIKLAIRDPSDCIEFPIYPIMPEKTQEVRGHVAFPPKGSGIEHDKNYVLDKVAQLAEIGIKEITIHTMGLTLKSLDAIATFVQGYGAILNIENRKAGRTSRVKDLTKILWATGADLTFDIGHTEANGNTVEYTLEYQDFIRNAHLYATEGDHGHEPFKDYNHFVSVLNNLLVLPCLEWIVIEANQADKMVEWYKKRMEIIDYLQKEALEEVDRRPKH